MGAPNDALPTLPVGEIVDLVDEDDYVIGRAPRREVRARNLLHREVAAIVRNPVGEIYVHRRTDTKDVFPGMYDMFVAGVVTSGESYDDAIRRELAEELGIEGAEPAFLIKSRYRDSEINWWTCCYEVMWDGPIVHQEEEIAWGRFMPEDELIASLDEFPFVPDGLVVFRRYLDERARYRLHIQPDLRRNGCHGGHRLDGPTKLHADISVQAADAG